MRLLGAVVLTTLVAGVARADCAADIAGLTPRVAAVPTKTDRVRLEGLLERARRELLENDETECHWATDRVAQALRQVRAPGD